MVLRLGEMRLEYACLPLLQADVIAPRRLASSSPRPAMLLSTFW